MVSKWQLNFFCKYNFTSIYCIWEQFNHKTNLMGVRESTLVISLTLLTMKYRGHGIIFKYLEIQSRC